MAQSSLTIQHPSTKIKHIQICPDGQHILEMTPEGEFVCRLCSMVQTVSAELDRYGEASATKTDHYPCDSLMLVPMGSQHDMINPASRGLAMDLGIGSVVKDYAGKRCKPMLLNGYVTGQVVGKRSEVYEIEMFDLTLSCKDKKTGEPHCIFDLKERPKEKTWICPVCRKEREIVNVHRYLAPKARKSFTDDTIFRESKMAAHNLSVDMQLDPISRFQYGRCVDKAFSDWVNLSRKVLPLLAFFRMQLKVKGLGVKASQDMVDDYAELLEELRTMLVEPLGQFNELG